MKKKNFALIDQRRIDKVEVDWLTPPGLIALLGPFDLDPCASVGQPWKTAARMIVLPEDGLKAEWGSSFTFCNPPYGRALKPWTKRMAEHNNGILLVPAATEMSWFKPIWLRSSGIFFIYDRVMFYYPASFKEKAGTLCPNKWRPHVLAGFGARAEEALAKLKIPGSYVGGWVNSPGTQSFYRGDDKK